MADLGTDATDDLLQRSRRLLDAVRRGETPPDGEPVTVTTEAADGLVRVVAGEGRIESIDLDPRAMRLDSRTLSEELTAAVNAALDELRASAGSAQGVDLAALDGQLRQVQDEGVRRMAEISSAVQAVMARIHRDRA
ncbi:YbaB/EbfC family nucleoid-associated protein [Actinoplanes subglobosus]|uniref:YbaB/EbfC family nucleoid-associated protein n=1 Tax=Actinoplanes subglobosus TaxID=1547892 RepID=A0ABV8IYM2_9ACTN